MSDTQERSGMIPAVSGWSGRGFGHEDLKSVGRWQRRLPVLYRRHQLLDISEPVVRPWVTCNGMPLPFPRGEYPAACCTATVRCSFAAEATCEGINTTNPAPHPHRVMQDAALAGLSGLAFSK